MFIIKVECGDSEPCGVYEYVAGIYDDEEACLRDFKIIEDALAKQNDSSAEIEEVELNKLLYSADFFT